MSLTLSPPKIDPTDYLTAEEAQKVAAVKLTSPPSYWDDEIRQTLLREHPYIPADRIIVNFTHRDETNGSAFGYVSISGSPTVSIPVIIKNREMSPLDVLIVRSPDTAANPGQSQQGAGDATDDQVVPLDEDTFAHAMDAGTIGDVIPQHQITGAAYSEDGSALRLPFRGRTVLASAKPELQKQLYAELTAKTANRVSLAPAVGITDAQKVAFGKVLGSSPEICAGFYINETVPTVDGWLSAPAAANSLYSKIASVHIERGIATVLTDTPAELKTADFLAADVFVEGESTKTAIAFDAISLAHPEKGLSRWLAFDDNSYCVAPEKVAGFGMSKEAEATAVTLMLDKSASVSLRLGQTLVFHTDNVFTAPAKLASVKPQSDGVVNMVLTDGLDRVDVMVDYRIKQATYEETTGTWIFPTSVQLLALNDHSEIMPMEASKIALALEKTLTDQLICADGQYTLVIRGETLGMAQISEAKMATMLNTWLSNGSELMEQAKTAGVIRFGSNIHDVVANVTKTAGAIAELPRVLAENVEACKFAFHPKPDVNFARAVKLAAAIGDPEGVDAVLGAGFLTQDNLAEFVNLSGQFNETVGKLARLLLAIRMGFPGDETATVVAMKSLARVADRLQSAGQEV